MNYTKDEILSQTKAVMVKLFDINESQLVPEALLYEDLDIDSIDAVDLLIELKKIAGANINPENFKEAKTLQDLIDIIADL